MAQLNDNFPKHLTEKYKGISHVLLDVPRIEPDAGFVETFYNEAKHVLRLEKTTGYPFTKEEAEEKVKNESWFRNEYVEEGCNWKGLYLTPTPDKTMKHVILDGKKQFPKLFEQIETYFPFKKIHTIRCWDNQYPIGLHRDIDEQYPGLPSSLRVILEDNNPEPTFWLAPKPEDKKGWGYERINKGVTDDAIFVDTTTNQETNSFAFNNYEFCHAAKKMPGHSKILMFVLCEWEWEGYERLIDRSIEKYGRR
jgi:hypothetical protein